MKWPLPDIKRNIPAIDSPGDFGYKRSFYYHPGIDLYCELGQAVVAIEDGVIVNIEMFTGHDANPSSPWWNDTWAVLVKGTHGVIGYCEILANPNLYYGQEIKEDDFLGVVIPVLKKDKGNGTTMLHLEHYTTGTRNHVTWHHGESEPKNLLNPRHLLNKIIGA
jgi:hypothetical protein